MVLKKLPLPETSSVEVIKLEGLGVQSGGVTEFLEDDDLIRGPEAYSGIGHRLAQKDWAHVRDSVTSLELNTRKWKPRLQGSCRTKNGPSTSSKQAKKSPVNCW